MRCGRFIAVKCLPLKRHISNRLVCRHATAAAATATPRTTNSLRFVGPCSANQKYMLRPNPGKGDVLHGRFVMVHDAQSSLARYTALPWSRSTVAHDALPQPTPPTLTESSFGVDNCVVAKVRASSDQNVEPTARSLGPPGPPLLDCQMGRSLGWHAAKRLERARSLSPSRAGN